MEENKKDETKSDSLIVLERYEKEQQEELTLLQLMSEQTGKSGRLALAKEIDLPWQEYKRLVRKYKAILKKASRTVAYTNKTQVLAMIKERII